MTHIKNDHKILKKVGTFFKWFSLLCLTIGVIGFTGGVYYLRKVIKETPKVDAQYLDTHGTSKIIDVDGDIIWQPTDHRMENITYDEMKDSLYLNGLITVEDKTFWTNPGVDYTQIAKMILGVARESIDKSYIARGGSTLSQQLIKNVYYNGGVGYSTKVRKIQEIFLAQQLDENFTKEQILTYYVNNLKFAEGAQGIKTIMKTYFNKSFDDYKERTNESIAEQAYLIGLGQAPTTYNIYENINEATERKDIVLGVLLKSNLITQEEYEGAKQYDLSTNLQPRYWESEAQRVKNLKYKVYTDEVLDEVKSMGYNIDDATLTIKSFLHKDTFDAITQKVREDKYYQDGVGGNEQVGVTVMDKDGIVVGLVGSRFENDELNRATQQTRSSGSSTKPFTAYGPLLQYKGDSYNTASLFDTSAYPYPGSSAIMYNFGRYTYGMQSLQYSLRMSLNTPVGRIADDLLGSGRMKTFLNGVGLDVKDQYSSVDAIGLNISSLQLAAAYNTLNNGGVYTKPRFVDKITFTDGSEKTIEPIRHRAMNESTAFVLSQILRGTVHSPYTARVGAISQYDGYAGKTGSVAFDENTNAPATYGTGGSDIWFASMTNNGYTVTVWQGYDEPNTSPQLTDGLGTQQVLGRDLQLMMNGNRTVENWTQPANVKNLGGSGIEVNYAITDSQDVGSSTGVFVPSITGYNDLFSKITSNSVEDKWEDSLQSNSFYQLYKNKPTIIDDTTTINQELYDLLPN